ncbi:MAG: glycosyltransferase family 2 protein [Oceanospirillaceae bacterium]|nr:glycosyltransferase family 2 protein [Oceanospirillaceae bacterium]
MQNNTASQTDDVDQTATTPVISLVIPVYNEIDVLPLLFERVTKVMEEVNLPYEMVMVDDGSKDASSKYLIEQAQNNDHIKALIFSRNFGKEAALSAGLEHACGEAIIVLDADLQNPPELIPDMLQKWRDGADIVAMKRRDREGESRAKQLGSYFYYRIMNRITGPMSIPEDTGDFRLMSRRSLDSLNRLPERNRYMKGLFAWVGYPTHVMEYDVADRAAGETKWNYFNLFGLAFEGITSFSIAPLRAMVILGLVTALLGSIFGFWIVFKTLAFGNDLDGYPSIIAMITFLGGVQLLSIGVLGEYVGKTYFEAKQRPLFIIQDVVQKTVKSSSHQSATQTQGTPVNVATD